MLHLQMSKEVGENISHNMLKVQASIETKGAQFKSIMISL